MRRKIRRLFLMALRAWLLLTAAVLALAGGVLTGWGVTHLHDLPEVRQLETFRPMESTRVLAGDGTPIHEFTQQRRTVIAYAEVPEFFFDALIATEDSRFHEHWGLDFIGVARAFVRNLQAGGVVEGGSSITQQLAKVLFLTQDRTYSRKAKEALLALQIEMNYSKEKILELYANQIYLGHGVYGIEAAADYYYGKRAADLTHGELAMLVGLIRNPGRYDPYVDMERALRRRETVLARMLAEGRIDESEADCIAREPLMLKERIQTGETPGGNYFVEEVAKVLTPRYSSAVLYGGGLTVRTTMDPEMQAWAEEALEDGLRRLDKQKARYRGPEANIPEERLATHYDPSWRLPLGEGAVVRAVALETSAKQVKLRIGVREAVLATEGAAWAGIRDFSKTFKRGDLIQVRVGKLSKEGVPEKLTLEQDSEFQGAVLALRPSDGAILAMVGGYRFSESKFNRALQARRQPGSTFKPFIYAAAFEQGFTPADQVMDEPTVFYDPASGHPYMPDNYEKDFEGLVTLRHALEKSRNVPTVRLLNQMGTRETIEKIRRFGFRGAISPYPSMALGSNEVSLLELTSAFSVFAAGGLRAAPYFIESVESPREGELERHAPAMERVISPEAAYVTAQVLRGVFERGTAARYARLPAVCGKTGTTDAYTDAWFIGFTKDLALGVWVGYDKKVTMGRGTVGAVAALPIWADFMERHLKRLEEPPALERPERVAVVPVDRLTGLRATLASRCEDIVFESFILGSEPTEPCSEAAHRLVALGDWREQRRALSAGSDAMFPRLLRPPDSGGGNARRLLNAMAEPRKRFSNEDARRDAVRMLALLRSGTPLAVEAVK